MAAASMSIVIEDISSKCTAEDGEKLAYFYCNQTERPSDVKNVATILQSIVLQLSNNQSHTRIMDSAMQLYKRKRGTGSLNETECARTIVELTNQYPLTTIVIDALDACEDIDIRYSLMICLQNILQESKSLVKIFVSSRNLGDVENQMKVNGSILREVGMRIDDTEEDIRHFVEEQLANYIERRWLLNGEIQDDLRMEINAKLCQGAQGMFRWVQLSLQTLREAGQPQVLRDLLNRLPKKLEDLYEIIFQPILNYHPDDFHLVERALNWLLYGETSLYTSDFVKVVSINPYGSRAFVSKEILLRLCCNLVEEEKELDHFRLAHLSVKEFLEKKHGYFPSQGHLLIAETCVFHLCSIGIDPIADVHEVGRFTGYAVVYWPRHCKKATSESDGDLTKLLREGAIFEASEPMIAAAAYRLSPGMMEMLLEKSSGSQITDTTWKAAAGNERSGKEMIELLSSKSDIRITQEILQAAARNLRSGAEIMKFLFGKTNKEEVSSLLIKADCTITEGVVEAVAYTFDAEMMDLVLSKNINVEITSVVAEAAAKNEQSGKEVTSLLLSKGIITKTEGRSTTAAEDVRREQELANLLRRSSMTMK